MTTVASRDLRNHTADVLRKVEGGDRITITVNGRPVAELGPPPTRRPTFLTKREAIGLLANRRADPTIKSDLTAIAGDTTEDLGAIR